MNLEQQVCSLELAKKLKELGVKQESLFVWEYFNEKCYGVAFVPFAVVQNPAYSHLKWFSAFTVAELGMMLPDWTQTIRRLKDDWCCLAIDKNSDVKWHSFAMTEADARAKMLIHLIENKLLEKL